MIQFDYLFITQLKNYSVNKDHFNSKYHMYLS